MKEGLRLSNEESNRITKESIQISLMKLLETKEINTISITEIVKKAGVSRTAFYRNYRSKEDVLFELLSTIINYLKTESNNIIVEKDEYNFIYRIITKIKENKKQFKILFTIELSTENRKKIEDYVKNLFNEKISIETKYLLIGCVAGLKNIILQWIENDTQEDIDTMTNICVSFLKNNINIKENLK